jgi:phage/plasmid-like protein (TIGR03299 family)
MTAENLDDLRANTRIGLTRHRGNAWHYRVGDPDSARNHYEDAVPMDAVLDLFSFELVSCELGVKLPEVLRPPVEIMPGVFVDNPAPEYAPAPGRQAIVRGDTGAVLGVFKDGYEIHQYREWLLNQVANILDDDLAIGSAGLLKDGAQAWVSVEVPENITTPEGVEFRPNLTACTSCDGSLATTYKRMVQMVVCDNTLAAGLGEVGQQLKIKHSKYSKLRIAEARDALAMIHSVAEDFQAEVAALCRIDVTDKAWQKFVEAHVPLADDAKGRALTMATNEREALTQLWNNDLRVSPWKGTAFGVLQAVNTYTHHIQTVRGASRPERNMSNAVTGKTAALDVATVGELMKVLAAA